MASGPWRGRPMKKPLWPEVGPAQEKVIRHRCTYRYGDGAQCIYFGDEVKEEGGMCTAHRIIGLRRGLQQKSDHRRQLRKTETRRKDRQKIDTPAPTPPEPPTPGPSIDPSAPYCTCKNRIEEDQKECVTCGKLQITEWAERRRGGKG